MFDYIWFSATIVQSLPAVNSQIAEVTTCLASALSVRTKKTVRRRPEHSCLILCNFGTHPAARWGTDLYAHRHAREKCISLYGSNVFASSSKAKAFAKKTPSLSPCFPMTQYLVDQACIYEHIHPALGIKRRCLAYNFAEDPARRWIAFANFIAGYIETCMYLCLNCLIHEKEAWFQWGRARRINFISHVHQSLVQLALQYRLAPATRSVRPNCVS
jgi:hypothetical protein